MMKNKLECMTKRNKNGQQRQIHPTRSSRYGCYQYGQVLQTSLSQAPPQAPYRIYDDTRDRKVFTVTRCSRSDVVID